MFGAKRKARKIQVSEEHEEPTEAPAPATDELMKDAPPTENTASTPTVKFTRRPVKSSSLRRTVNISDDHDGEQRAPAGSGDNDEESDEARPTVIRPAVNRSGSSKLKKKGASARLSFGVSEEAGDRSSTTSSSSAPPKKNPSAANLAQRAAENSAVRASLSSRNLPTRSFGAEQERPSYSKEYLEELQSSTPNTPQNLESLRIHDDDDDGNDNGQMEAMSLDAAELEGAVFVPTADLPMSSLRGTSSGHIPSAAEVREKKERRARLAKEGDAYKSDAEDDDEDGYISLLPKKKKDETRLIAEDEDLGEGYDEFVEDGRLQLGKRGDQAAKRQHRREMEELINAAEGASEGEDTDSDAERKAAYEAAQTRAAMDGLHRLADQEDASSSGASRLMIPRMKPLPELAGSLARMRALVEDMEAQLSVKQKRVEEIEKEKQEILNREKEVQDILNQAGMKYQSAMGVKTEDVVDPAVLAAQSPLRTGGAPALQIKAEERGLESFGTTPTRRPGDENGEEMEE